MSNTYAPLQNWLISNNSQVVIACEQFAVEAIVNSFRPFRSLELVNAGLMLRNAPKDHVVLSHEETRLAKSAQSVVTDMGRLPFVSESFDLVVCAHVHETSACAGEMISEISRVLIPGGLCIVFGFNPQGFWRQADFSIESWWRYPMAISDCQSLGQLFSLTTVYTDHLGFGMLTPPQQPWLRASVRMVKQTLPSVAILYKLVMRKEVLSQTPLLVDEANLMHGAGV